MASGKLLKNYAYIRQQLNALLKSTSTTVKCIWLIVFISYALSFLDGAVDIIGVTPGYFMPPHFRVWSALTFCFLETHFWNVLIDVVMIAVCGKVIEPLWGPTEIIGFFAIVNIGVALCSAFFYLFVYMCSSNPDLLFNVHIHGLSGYIAGVTVAVKQIMPDINIVKTPTTRITNKNMPFLTVTLAFIFWLVGLSPGSTLVMVIFGIYVSWIYLRFYQRHSSDKIGDMSDSLTFASLFPSCVQPPIAILANSMYELLVKMNVCKRHTPLHDANSDLSEVTVNLLGFDSQDKERRKQKALKALSEHLNKADRPRIVGIVTPQKTKSPSVEEGASKQSFSSGATITTTDREQCVDVIDA